MLGWLKVEFRAKLNNSSGEASGNSTRDRAEGFRVERINDGVRVGVEVLGEIEEVSAELKIDGLREDKALGGGEVVVNEAGHSEGICAWGIPKSGSLSGDKCGGIEVPLRCSNTLGQVTESDLIRT